MATYVGGLRARLVSESIFAVVKSGLTALGWFNPGQHFQPITLVHEAQDIETQIPINTLAVSDENITEVPTEIGSVMSEHNWIHYVDFYAESEVLGKQVIFDARDILLGRFTAIGRNAPVIDVYDWTMATPPLIFSVEVDEVRVDRAHNFPHPYLRNWWSIQFRTIDAYAWDSP